MNVNINNKFLQLKEINFFFLSLIIFLSTLSPRLFCADQTVWAYISGTTFPFKIYSSGVVNTVLSEIQNTADGITTATDQAVAYVPINPGDATTEDELEYSILEEPSGIFSNAADATAFVSMIVKVATTSASSRTLWAAVKKDGSWSSIDVYQANDKASSNVELVGGTNYTVSAFMNYSDLCQVNEEDICLPSGTTTKTIEVYIFPEKEGQDVQVKQSDDYPTTHPGGLYLTIHLSSKINSSDSYKTTITNIQRGDRRLSVTFTGINIDKGHAIAFYESNNPLSSVPNPAIDTSTHGQKIVDIRNDFTLRPLVPEDYTISGKVTLKDLVNGNIYGIVIAQVDKFYFATKVSQTAWARPEGIETFLTKQSCYLLSSGFQEEHEVIEYFKKFRDEVLQKYHWGQAFIEYYYKTAPQYTRFIYQSETISFLVRAGGYSLYYLFRFFPYVIALATALLLIALLKTRRLGNRSSFSIMKKRLND